MAERFKPDAADPAAQRNLLRTGLTDDERGITLATLTGGAYTLGDAHDDIRTGGQGPNVWMLPLVERWIEGQVLQRALREEARRRRLPDEPANARTIREREDERLLEGVPTAAGLDPSHPKEQ